MEDKVKGLKNKGNMCFLNVIIQALWNSDYIKDFIFNLKENNHSHQKVMHSSQLLEFITKLKQQLKQDDDNYLEENISMLKQNTSILTNSLENDENNCLLCFLKKFFETYKSSNEKTLNASNMREVLVSLNDHIMKFNYSGV